MNIGLIPGVVVMIYMLAFALTTAFAFGAVWAFIPLALGLVNLIVGSS